MIFANILFIILFLHVLFKFTCCCCIEQQFKIDRSLVVTFLTSCDHIVALNGWLCIEYAVVHLVRLTNTESVIICYILS